MATVTLRALAVEWGKAGEASIDHLTLESGFLRVAQALPASHKALHRYKRIDSLPSFSVVEPGGSIGDTTVDTNLLEARLAIVEAHQSESVDIVRDWPAGKSAYFNQQRPSYLEAYGQQVSKMIFYGYNSDFGNVGAPPGLHQLAKAYGNITQMGGTTGSRSTIFAVRFRSGPNGCAVLFDPAVSTSGEIMTSELVNGGAMQLETTTAAGNQKKKVYQVVHSGKMGFLSSSSYDVAAITQIVDNASDRPTATKMDLIIDQVRGDLGNCFIFMNRSTRRLLQLLDDDKLSTDPGTTKYYSWLNSWTGIPIIIDGNLSSVETTVLD